MIRFLKYKVKCNKKGEPYLTRLIRVYYNIQRNNKINENLKSTTLNKIYEIVKTRNSNDIKKAARIEMKKDYADNVYSLFCNYIILTGEL